jgi:hypothetical protein
MRPIPRLQLCIHRRHGPTGSWASHTTGQTTRRPSRLACCQGPDQGRDHTIPFDGHADARRRP